jgi:predicted nucleotidyltransferase
MNDLVRLAMKLVAEHPAVNDIRLAGSRSRGTHEELSDWDFAVTTSDFAALALDMPALVAPLKPMGEQWEPLGHFPVYQVLLEGPTKVEYLFLDYSQDAAPSVTPSAATLRGIDNHFWDWIWWISTKASIGRVDLVAEHLRQLHEHLLRPMGVEAVPESIDAAIDQFVARRDELQQAYGVSVSHALEREVRGGFAELLGSTSDHGRDPRLVDNAPFDRIG